MLINFYGEFDAELWVAANLVGASLIFRNSGPYGVTVHQDGYLIGTTHKRQNSREWVEWLRGL